uniref:Galactose-specific lectin nattectin-like n=1 Tax=Sinocyclocheilus rhinocerous TaxID=307959 RepID=A0A673J238_9TELE
MWISAAVLIALVVNGVKSEGSSGIGRRCTKGWEKLGTQCFRYFSDLKPWAEAEKQCLNLGGNLVSIHSQLTHNFLKTLVKKHGSDNSRTWIGAHDAIKHCLPVKDERHEIRRISTWKRPSLVMFFRMISGFGVIDQNLSTVTGEPNNGGGKEHCVEMGSGGEKRWNDAHCDTLLNFICCRTTRNNS